MSKKYLYIILVSICFNGRSFAQEFLTGLRVNPEIIVSQSKTKSFLKSGKIIDTLSLPFFDDFSGKSIYPDQDKWLDKDVYINTRFARTPPSIGFATFDAIDQYGRIHDNAKTTPFGADTLTSKPIFLGPDYSIKVNSVDFEGISISDLYYFDTCMSSYKLFKDSTYIKENDSTYVLAGESNFYNLNDSLYYKCDSNYYLLNDSLYFYNPDSSNYFYLPRDDASRRLWNEEDSVVLTFYYLPQGIADAPDERDSLILQFYAPEEGKWHSRLSFIGREADTTEFSLVTVPIVEEKYLHKGFQFRFVNLASISNDPQYGITNCDFWHIDYVYLDKGRRSDSIFFNDVAQVIPLGSFLKNYETIPWEHYTSEAYNNERKSRFEMKVRNFNQEGKGPHRVMMFRDYDNDTLLFTSDGPIATPIDGLELLSIDTTNMPIPIENNDNRETARYELIAVIHNADSLEIGDNDTISYIQDFRNYYAYDDGSAEAGYFLSGQGTINAKGAMFNEYFLSDTLKAVQFYFNQSYDSANFVKFKIVIWEDLNDEPGEIIYEFDEQYPQFKGINKFCEFTVPEDTVIVLPKRVWVGWIQTTEDPLDIGFDLNNKRSKLMYNINGEWTNSSFYGTLMVRTVFDRILPLKIKEPVLDNKPDILVYPNPAKEQIYIQHPFDLEMTDLNYQVYNSIGQLMFTSEYYTDKIDVRDWKNGFYFIKISDQATFVVNKKIIISH